MDILSSALELASQPRAEARDYAHWLGWRILKAEQEAGFPLVSGEEGAAYVPDAINRLTVGRTRKECGKPGSPVSHLEARLQAEVVVAGVTAAHEFVTGEPVSIDAQTALTEAMANFGLREKHEAEATVAA